MTKHKAHSESHLVLFQDYNEPIDSPRLGTEMSSEPGNNLKIYAVPAQLPDLSQLQHTADLRVVLETGLSTIINKITEEWMDF